MEWSWIPTHPTPPPPVSCYPSKDAEMKLGHILFVKLSNCIEILRVAMVDLNQNTFLSLKCNLRSLFTCLWGTAKDCGRKGQVTPGVAGKPLRFLVAWLTRDDDTRDGQLGSRYGQVKWRGAAETFWPSLSVWDTVCYLCLSRLFHATDLLP